MEFFECCKNCPKDKRHPGCHSTCEEYKESKALKDAYKDQVYFGRLAESRNRPAKTDYLNKPVWRNKRH